MKFLTFLFIIPLLKCTTIDVSSCTSKAMNCLNSKKNPQTIAYSCTDLITLYYCVNRAFVNCSSSTYSSQNSDLFKFDRSASSYTQYLYTCNDICGSSLETKINSWCVIWGNLHVAISINESIWTIPPGYAIGIDKILLWLNEYLEIWGLMTETNSTVLTKALSGVEIVLLDPCNYKNLTFNSETANANQTSGKTNNTFTLKNLADGHTKINISGIRTTIEIQKVNSSYLVIGITGSQGKSGSSAGICFGEGQGSNTYSDAAQIGECNLITSSEIKKACIMDASLAQQSYMNTTQIQFLNEQWENISLVALAMINQIKVYYKGSESEMLQTYYKEIQSLQGNFSTISINATNSTNKTNQTSTNAIKIIGMNALFVCLISFYIILS